MLRYFILWVIILLSTHAVAANWFELGKLYSSDGRFIALIDIDSIKPTTDPAIIGYRAKQIFNHNKTAKIASNSNSDFACHHLGR